MFDQVQTQAESLTPRQKGDLLKKVIELLAPDLQAFYPTTVKGRIEKVYTTNDHNFYCDVQPLNNDESVNEDRAIITKVDIPILYAGQDRGIVCQPIVGLLCDITYYNGDENYPAISNTRYTNNKTPTGVQPGELLIQKGPGNFIKFKNDGSRKSMIPGNSDERVGKTKNETVGGNFNVQVKKDRIDLTHGNHVIVSHKKLLVGSRKETKLKGKSIILNSDDKMEIDAGSSLSVGGAKVNIVSEDSLILFATGHINQTSTGPHLHNAANFKQILSNVQAIPVTDTYDLQVLLGSHNVDIIAGDQKTSLLLGDKITNLVAGNMETKLTLGNLTTELTFGNLSTKLLNGDYEVDILGKFTFTNGPDSMLKISEKIYDTINAAFVKIQEVITEIGNLKVPTGVGPSGMPMNTAQFEIIKGEIDTFVSTTLDVEKQALSNFFKA